MTATLTAREFNQDTARAKRAAAEGPVFVTDRGRPTHVLLTVEAYERLTGPKQNIVEALYDPASALIDLPLPERSTELPRDVNFGSM
jgi:prevent-host-death family protein